MIEWLARYRTWRDHAMKRAIQTQRDNLFEAQKDRAAGKITDSILDVVGVERDGWRNRLADRILNWRVNNCEKWLEKYDPDWIRQ